MPHADTSYIPSTIHTKSEIWAHIYLQLQALFEDQRNWVSNLANASSLIYNSLLAFPPQFGSAENAVNWCGFYLNSSLFPTRKNIPKPDNRLLLGPFCGRPACQFINVTPGHGRGVCADAYMQKQTLVVPNVADYAGHIACDGDTKSELVCPLLLGGVAIGVLDLDCVALEGFSAEDQEGVEKVAELIVASCDW
ncbi:GAF domain-like protein [Rickenella mellea]|uniref:GAF domain-like protein n=1 Tax=Rickenella mellea TaxID=50990 RepID=A0A4Y7QEC5_9AGAM|nr:GAF domain-like protein [Rickenella mellea]